MKVFIIILVTAFLITILNIVFEHMIEKNAKKEEEAKFASGIEESFMRVKKYCSKFPESLDHMHTILKAFEELVNDKDDRHLKAFDGYTIPTHQFHFTVDFYILVDENLTYKLVITDNTINIKDDLHDVDEDVSISNVKRYLPYAKTLDEFREFVDECQKLHNENSRDMERRNHVSMVLKKNVK